MFMFSSDRWVPSESLRELKGIWKAPILPSEPGVMGTEIRSPLYL